MRKKPRDFLFFSSCDLSLRHPIALLALILSILLGQQGCTTTPPKPWPSHINITEEVRATTRIIEIDISEELPHVDLELPSKGAVSGAGRNARKWSGNWAKAGVLTMMGGGGGAIITLVLGAAMLAVSPVIALVGAIDGAIEAPSAELVESQETQVQVALQSTQLLRQLENHLLTQVRNHTDLSATLRPKETDEQASHQEEGSATAKPDRILRVHLHSIKLHGPFDVDPPLELHFNVQATLTKHLDTTLQYTRSFRYVTEARRLAEWIVDDEKHLREAIDRSLARLAEWLIDDLFLTYPFAHEHRGAKHES